jgi:hypothetical protein
MRFALGILFTSRNPSAHGRTKRNAFLVTGGLPRGELTPPNVRYTFLCFVTPPLWGSLNLTPALGVAPQLDTVLDEDLIKTIQYGRMQKADAEGR